MPFQSSKDWFDEEEEKKPIRRRKDAPISPLARPKWLEDKDNPELDDLIDDMYGAGASNFCGRKTKKGK